MACHPLRNVLNVKKGKYLQKYKEEKLVLKVWSIMAGDWSLGAHSNPKNSFQKAMCLLLVAGQCFALMPVSGLMGKLRFRWLSCRVALSFFSMTGVTFLLVVQTKDLLAMDKITYSSCAGTIFFTVSVVSTMMFLRLAVKWSGLVGEFDVVDRKYGYPHHLARKCRITAGVMLTASTVEHVMALYSGLRRVLTCPELLRAFYMVWFGSVFRMTRYALWKAFLLQFTNFLATFTWSYLDMFITLVSLNLQARFTLCNQRLALMRGKVAPRWQWREAREHYDALCVLTRTVDSHISHLVLLCLFSDLYFICLQLFNSIQNVDSLYGYVFFFYSFGYLLIRACAMCFCAASVHEASLRPKSALFAVPSSCYNHEVNTRVHEGANPQIFKYEKNRI